MNKKLSKREAREQIEEFFSNIKNKTTKEVKKIKKLAMRHNIPFKEKRKLFCKKCFKPYSRREKVKIKRGRKAITCENCGYLNRWRISSF